MGLLYVTADSVGAPTGGGLVTQQELRALKELSEWATLEKKDPLMSRVGVLCRENLDGPGPDPWKWDQRAVTAVGGDGARFRLCHIYAGTWPTLVPHLKERGCKVVVTIAAHDKEVSRREHEALGWGFNLPHLTDPKLWKQYIEGYRLVDVIVCPSTVAEKTVRAYGPEFAKKDIRVIPHGCELPTEVVPLPKNFVVGYMGSLGADKGVHYLLEAWKKLDYKDGSLLVLAGRDSGTPLARQLLARYGGGPVHLMGWVDDVSKFYNAISCYVQPSATEGFGIEVLEAMAHGRPVICSDAAGAVDLVREPGVGSLTYAMNTQHLADLIDGAKNSWDLAQLGWQAKKRAEGYTWGKVREQYKALWKGVLGW